MIPVSVDIDNFFMTLSFIIFFYHHPIHQLQVYKINAICYLWRNFLDIVFDKYVRGGMVGETATKNVE